MQLPGAEMQSRTSPGGAERAPLPAMQSPAQFSRLCRPSRHADLGVGSLACADR